MKIYMEGFLLNGAGGSAHCIGDFEGSNIDEAVANWLIKEPRMKNEYRYNKDTGFHSWWSCRIYDNMNDARQLNG